MRLAATDFYDGQRGELSVPASFSDGYANSGDLTAVDVDAGMCERSSRKRLAIVAASSAIKMTITARCSALVRMKMFFIAPRIELGRLNRPRENLSSATDRNRITRRQDHLTLDRNSCG